MFKQESQIFYAKRQNRVENQTGKIRPNFVRLRKKEMQVHKDQGACTRKKRFCWKKFYRKKLSKNCTRQYEFQWNNSYFLMSVTIQFLKFYLVNMM